MKRKTLEEFDVMTGEELERHAQEIGRHSRRKATVVMILICIAVITLQITINTLWPGVLPSGGDYEP